MSYSVQLMLLVGILVTLAGVSCKLYASDDIQASYYWDNRNFNTTTLQISKNNLGFGLSFWGFTDLHSQQQNTGDRYDFNRTFSEYRLSSDSIAAWSGIDNLGLQLEYNDATPGTDNNALRFGLTYKQHLNKSCWLQYRIFPLQSRNDGQLNVAFFLKFTEDLNLTGFADFNIIEGGDNQWVYEPQLNYRLGKNTWMLLEYRYNGFEKINPGLDGTGIAFGIRYNFN